MRLIFIFLSLLVYLNGFGQVGLKISQVRPANDLGMVFNKTTSIELSSFSRDSDRRLQLHYSLSYTSLTPRVDTFRIYAITNKDGSYKVYPGYQIYTKYELYFLGFGIDYCFINAEKINVYAGFDVIMGASAIEYKENYETISDYEYSGGDMYGGLRFRIGTIFYISEKFACFAEAVRNAYLDENKMGFTYNEVGCGIRYYFRER